MAHFVATKSGTYSVSNSGQRTLIAPAKTQPSGSSQASRNTIGMPVEAMTPWEKQQALQSGQIKPAEKPKVAPEIAKALGQSTYTPSTNYGGGKNYLPGGQTVSGFKASVTVPQQQSKPSTEALQQEATYKAGKIEAGKQTLAKMLSPAESQYAKQSQLSASQRGMTTMTGSAWRDYSQQTPSQLGISSQEYNKRLEKMRADYASERQRQAEIDKYFWNQGETRASLEKKLPAYQAKADEINQLVTGYSSNVKELDIRQQEQNKEIEKQIAKQKPTPFTPKTFSVADIRYELGVGERPLIDTSTYKQSLKYNIGEILGTKISGRRPKFVSPESLQIGKEGREAYKYVMDNPLIDYESKPEYRGFESVFPATKNIKLGLKFSEPVTKPILAGLTGFSTGADTAVSIRHGYRGVPADKPYWENVEKMGETRLFQSLPFAPIGLSMIPTAFVAGAGGQITYAESKKLGFDEETAGLIRGGTELGIFIYAPYAAKKISAPLITKYTKVKFISDVPSTVGYDPRRMLVESEATAKKFEAMGYPIIKTKEYGTDVWEIQNFIPVRQTAVANFEITRPFSNKAELYQVALEKPGYISAKSKNIIDFWGQGKVTSMKVKTQLPDVPNPMQRNIGYYTIGTETKYLDPFTEYVRSFSADTFKAGKSKYYEISTSRTNILSESPYSFEPNINKAIASGDAAKIDRVASFYYEFPYLDQTRIVEDTIKSTSTNLARDTSFNFYEYGGKIFSSKKGILFSPQFELSQKVTQGLQTGFRTRFFFKDTGVGVNLSRVYPSKFFENQTVFTNPKWIELPGRGINVTTKIFPTEFESPAMLSNYPLSKTFGNFLMEEKGSLGLTRTGAARTEQIFFGNAPQASALSKLYSASGLTVSDADLASMALKAREYTPTMTFRDIGRAGTMTVTLPAKVSAASYPITKSEYKTLTLTRSEAATKLPTISRTQTLTLTRTDIAKMNRSVGLGKTQTVTQTLTKADMTAPRTDVLSNTLTRTSVLTKTMAATKTLSKTYTPTKTQMKTITDIDMVVEIEPPPPGKIIFPILKDYSENFGFQKKSRGFKTLVKSKGKFFALPGLAEYETALSRGAKLVDISAAATFKVVPTNIGIGKGVPDFYFRKAAWKFRAPKRGGKDTFVERNIGRIDQPGELREITYKGIAAKKQKTQFNKLFGFKLKGGLI